MLDISFLPLVSLFIPFAGALILLCLYVYHSLIFAKSKIKVDISRKHLNTIFLIVLFVNFVMVVLVWLTYSGNGSVLFMTNSSSWAHTLPTDSRLNPASIMYVDAIGAISAFLISLIALVAGMRALADHKNVLSTIKASFMLLTLWSVQGVLYSNSLFSVLFFVAVVQCSCFGLYHNATEHMKTLISAAIYYLSRIMAFAMLTAGVVLIQFKYGTDIITVLSPLIKADTMDKFAFALMTAPLLYMFLQPPLYVTEPACSWYAHTGHVLCNA
jgi:hypothetical protein